MYKPDSGQAVTYLSSLSVALGSAFDFVASNMLGIAGLCIALIRVVWDILKFHIERSDRKQLIVQDNKGTTEGGTHRAGNRLPTSDKFL